MEKSQTAAEPNELSNEFSSVGSCKKLQSEQAFCCFYILIPNESPERNSVSNNCVTSLFDVGVFIMFDKFENVSGIQNILLMKSFPLFKKRISPEKCGKSNAYLFALSNVNSNF